MCINACFLVLDIRIVTGSAAVFHIQIGICKGPVSGLQRSAFIRFISGHQIQLHKETDDAGSI